MNSIGDAVYERFSAGKEGTLWYYRELAKTYLAVARESESQGLQPVAQALEGVVDSFAEVENNESTEF